jgi:NADH:ubiquinone oxidoreductase subunit H
VKIHKGVVGYFGLLQPLADGLKLFVKEFLCPSKYGAASASPAMGGGG